MFEGSDKGKSDSLPSAEKLPEGYSHEFIREQFNVQWMKLKIRHEDLFRDIAWQKQGDMLPLDKCEEFRSRVLSLRKDIEGFRVKVWKSSVAARGFMTSEADKIIGSLVDLQSKLTRVLHPEVTATFRTPQTYLNEVHGVNGNLRPGFSRRAEHLISTVTFVVVVGLSALLAVLGYRSFNQTSSAKSGKTLVEKLSPESDGDRVIQHAANEVIVQSVAEVRGDQWWKDGEMNRVIQNTRTLLTESADDAWATKSLPETHVSGAVHRPEVSSGGVRSEFSGTVKAGEGYSWTCQRLIEDAIDDVSYLSDEMKAHFKKRFKNLWRWKGFREDFMRQVEGAGFAKVPDPGQAVIFDARFDAVRMVSSWLEAARPSEQTLGQAVTLVAEGGEGIIQTTARAVQYKLGMKYRYYDVLECFSEGEGLDRLRVDYDSHNDPAEYKDLVPSGYSFDMGVSNLTAYAKTTLEPVGRSLDEVSPADETRRLLAQSVVRENVQPAEPEIFELTAADEVVAAVPSVQIDSGVESAADFKVSPVKKQPWWKRAGDKIASHFAPRTHSILTTSTISPSERGSIPYNVADQVRCIPVPQGLTHLLERDGVLFARELVKHLVKFPTGVRRYSPEAYRAKEDLQALTNSLESVCVKDGCIEW